jgi:hypothetical protein
MTLSTLLLKGNTMTTTNISHINYSFSTEGIHAALATRHLEFVQARLSTLFGIKTDAVKVTSKARLMEGAPFTLTCYSSRSESDTAAMAIAAKYVLPHLEDMKALTVEAAATIVGWVPGRSAGIDMEAAGIIGDGVVTELTTAQRKWLRIMAFRLDRSANVDSLSVENHAQMSLRFLMERAVRAKARRALRNKQDLHTYDYQRIRVKLANEETTTISMTCAVYMAMVRASRMSLPALNSFIRDVAKELSAMTQYVSLSQAVRVEVQNRLAGGAL